MDGESWQREVDLRAESPADAPRFRSEPVQRVCSLLNSIFLEKTAVQFKKLGNVTRCCECEHGSSTPRNWVRGGQLDTPVTKPNALEHPK